MTQITSTDLYTKPNSSFPATIYGFHTRLTTNFTVASVGPIREYAVVAHPTHPRSELFLKRKNGSLGKHSYVYSSLSLYDNLTEAEQQRIQAKEDLAKQIDAKVESLLLLKQGLTI